MKQIKINLNKISIQKAIEQLKLAKKNLKENAPSKFIMRCFDWVIDRANNYYLQGINMDARILEDISSKWEKDVTGNTGILRNTSEKATFVEFGVGVVAENNPHPKAQDENYEYNVKSGKKDSYDQWRFRLNADEPIDLNIDYYTADEEGEKTKVKTKGSPANLYLYNSIMDLISTGAYKIIWKQTLKSLL